MQWQALIHGLDTALDQDQVKAVLADGIFDARAEVCQTSYVIDPENLEVYLTQREAECAFYLMRGFTMKEIARDLALSPRTIEFYLKRIKEKMQTHSKSEVVRRLYDSHFALVNPFIADDLNRLGLLGLVF